MPPPKDWPASAAFSLFAQDVSAAGFSFRFQAVGQSMYPTICNGEMLHVEPLAEQKLGCGDIILFRRSDGIKAHRIVKITGKKTCITRGDASLQDDGDVNREQVIGRIIAKECIMTGKVITLNGLLAQTRFRLRKLRSRMGRLVRQRRPTSSL